MPALVLDNKNDMRQTHMSINTHSRTHAPVSAARFKLTLFLCQWEINRLRRLFFRLEVVPTVLRSLCLCVCMCLRAWCDARGGDTVVAVTTAVHLAL